MKTQNIKYKKIHWHKDGSIKTKGVKEATVRSRPKSKLIVVR